MGRVKPPRGWWPRGRQWETETRIKRVGSRVDARSGTAESRGVRVHVSPVAAPSPERRTETPFLRVLAGTGGPAVHFLFPQVSVSREHPPPRPAPSQRPLPSPLLVCPHHVLSDRLPVFQSGGSVNTEFCKVSVFWILVSGQMCGWKSLSPAL